MTRKLRVCLFCCYNINIEAKWSSSLSTEGQTSLRGLLRDCCAVVSITRCDYLISNLTISMCTRSKENSTVKESKWINDPLPMARLWISHLRALTKLSISPMITLLLSHARTTSLLELPNLRRSTEFNLLLLCALSSTILLTARTRSYPGFKFVRMPSSRLLNSLTTSPS